MRAVPWAMPLVHREVGTLHRYAITGRQGLARDGHLAVNDVQPVARSGAVCELCAGVPGFGKQVSASAL